MSRYPRQDPADGWHHVTNHATGHEQLFLNDTDRVQFLRRVNEASAKYNVTVAAFCLMGNHMHLVLICPEAGLSRFMHYVESIYAREFNMRHARRGALFGQKFHNKLILNDGQALATIRYVHRNPLELGIDIRTYPWSSYRSHIGLDDGLFSVDQLFFKELTGGPVRHRSYVETDFPHDAQTMAMGVRQVDHMVETGFEYFIVGLGEIAARIWATTLEEVLAPRSKARNLARLAVALVAAESSGHRSEQLRQLLGYRSASAFRSAVQSARRRTEQDMHFGGLVVQLRAEWSDRFLRRAS